MHEINYFRHTDDKQVKPTTRTNLVVQGVEGDDNHRFQCMTDFDMVVSTVIKNIGRGDVVKIL